MSLRADSVGFGYGERSILTGVTVEVVPGRVIGVVGPNGAGKSTLVRLLSGVEVPSTGEVTLDDVPLGRLPRRQVARRIAVAQQSSELPDGFRVEEIVAMGRSPHLPLLGREGERDRRIIGWALQQTGVAGLRGRRVGDLSGGERQRVVLARALAQEPEYLLLDEPTTHLDLRYQVEILRQVRSQALAGVGALVVLHDLNLAARACDHIALLSNGRVEAQGTPQEVLDISLLRRVYGSELELLVQEGGLPTLLPKL